MSVPAPADAPVLAVPETVLGAKKSPDERKAILARQISVMVARGRRVESQSDYQAVLVRGHRVHHGLQLFLTIITAGLWGFVWIGLVLLGGEKREMATVDEWGNSAIQKL
jgi:hypothetical protein